MRSRRYTTVLMGLALHAAAACEAEGIWQRPRASLERMQEQPGYRPYARNDAFADGRAMRPPPASSVRWQPDVSQHTLGRADIEEGRQLFEVFCAVCHGLLGDGDTVVAQHMRQVKPTRLLSERVKSHPDEQLERTVLQGYGLMAGLHDRLTPAQAQRVVAYLRALQLSQDIAIDDVPLSLRAHLSKGATP